MTPDQMEAEIMRLRGTIKALKRTADEWAISRTVGSSELEDQKANALWQKLRHLSAIADGPISTSGFPETDQ